MNWIKVDKNSEVPKHPMWITDGERVELWLNKRYSPLHISQVTHYIPFIVIAPIAPILEKDKE